MHSMYSNLDRNIIKWCELTPVMYRMIHFLGQLISHSGLAPGPSPGIVEVEGFGCWAEWGGHLAGRLRIGLSSESVLKFRSLLKSDSSFTNTYIKQYLKNMRANLPAYI